MKKEILKLVEMQLDLGKEICPKYDDIFRAFEFFAPKETKVIILGQDPYPQPKNAMGLAFSVPPTENIPQSLRRIFKELKQDVGVSQPKTGDLTPWAKQGVLLLNSILTTEAGKSLAHKKFGWEEYTTQVIQQIVDLETPLVIICWGKYAQEKLYDVMIHDKVLVLEGGHPSPLNTKIPFLGGKYFSKTNEWLKRHKVKEINWEI